MGHATLEDLRGTTRRRVREYANKLNLAWNDQHWPRNKSLLASAIADKEFKELAQLARQDVLAHTSKTSREGFTHIKRSAVDVLANDERPTPFEQYTKKHKYEPIKKNFLTKKRIED